MFSSVVRLFVLFPKWALSLILLKNSLVSLVNIFLLYFPAVGQKFKFFPNNLYSGILNLCFVRFMSLPKGSAWCLIILLNVSRILLKFALRLRCNRGFP